AGYQGRSECWTAGNSLPDLTRTRRDWDDRISSIRVFGRVTADIYSETRYKGDHLMVDHDISDLSQIRIGPGNGRGPQGRGNSADRGRGRGRGNRSWDNEVSSMRVQAPRRNADNRR
ncbi:MAG TPA: peptidase inhibitor family I36 protein, partial [Terriglobia bacterium]|nr:peptidase inhibitor family I36 protein [Terriglobia bacterium]